VSILTAIRVPVHRYTVFSFHCRKSHGNHVCYSGFVLIRVAVLGFVLLVTLFPDYYEALQVLNISVLLVFRLWCCRVCTLRLESLTRIHLQSVLCWHILYYRLF